MSLSVSGGLTRDLLPFISIPSAQININRVGILSGKLCGSLIPMLLSSYFFSSIEWKLCGGKVVEHAHAEIIRINGARNWSNFYPPIVEEFSGKPFEYEEILPVFEDYVADKKAAEVSPETRALADVCMLLFNSNEFIYIY